MDENQDSHEEANGLNDSSPKKMIIKEEGLVKYHLSTVLSTIKVCHCQGDFIQHAVCEYPMILFKNLVYFHVASIDQ